MSPIRTLVAVGLFVPLVALAEVGKVETLDGAATRTPQGGSETALAVDAAIEVGDTLTVKSGTLAVRLSDDSVLALDEGSSLRIDEADFGDLDAKKFSARLLLGALWAKVAPLVVGSGAKFEVTTDRAVAGVRGTAFSVEISPEAEEGVVIGVEEGEVAVDEVEAAAPVGAGSGIETKAGPRGPRASVILKPGKAWVYSRHGIRQRDFKMHAGRFATFVGKHRPMWHKRVLERIRERQVKLRLNQQELRAKEKLNPAGKEELRAKEKAVREKQQELRDKAKEIRRK